VILGVVRHFIFVLLQAAALTKFILFYLILASSTKIEAWKQRRCVSTVRPIELGQGSLDFPFL